MQRFLTIILALTLAFTVQLSRAEADDFSEGYYQVPVQLWNAYEDKPSMGNNGLVHQADLVVADGEARLYLQTQKLTVSTLTTSLVYFYVLDAAEEYYQLAERSAFTIAIPGKTGKNPEVFSFPLPAKKELLPVLVDVQVPFMGEDPIKARLHLDWQKLQAVAPEELKIYQLAEEHRGDHQDRGDFFKNGDVSLTLSTEIGGELEVHRLSRKDLEKKGLRLQPLDQVQGWAVRLAPVLLRIPVDHTSGVRELKEQVQLPAETILGFAGQAEVNRIYHLEGSTFKEMAFARVGDEIQVPVKELGTFALVRDKNLKNPASLLSAAPGKRPQTGTATGKSATAAKTKPASPKALPPKEPSAAEDRESLSEEDEAETAVEPQEQPGLIGLVIGFYLLCLLAGLWLWKRYGPLLREEVDRLIYILHFREDQKEEKHEI